MGAVGTMGTLWKEVALSTMEDSFLIQQILAGNSAAFKFLVHRYRRPVFKFLKGFALSETVIEELAQETFLRAFKSLDQYSPEKGASFSSWLFQITKNLALNELARSYQKFEVSFESSSFESSKDKSIRKQALRVPDRALSQHDLLEAKQRAESMGNAIGRLPPEFKSAVVLSCLKELSMEEIAEIEKCSVGTVKSRIFRGKELLRSWLMKAAEV